MAFLQQQPEQLHHKNKQADTSLVPPVLISPHDTAAGNRTSSKIRKIDAYPGSLYDIDIIDRLHNSIIGRFYVSHLKKYHIARWIVRWIIATWYSKIRPFCLIVRNSYRPRRYRTTKLREFIKEEGVSIYKLADEAFVEIPKPKVFPAHDQGCMVKPHDHYKFPEIYIAIINNGIVNGGTNLITVDDQVVCHDLYDFDCDSTSEELHGRALIDPKARRICWLLYDNKPGRIHAAASFVDACAFNYAHWMTEVLPRINMFCADKRFKDIPIVINDSLHDNIMESLFLVAGTDREIIILPVGRALRCNVLYVTSVTGYVPFGWRSEEFMPYSQGMFSPQALHALRSQILGLAQNTKRHALPKKIFIRRNSANRKCENSVQIEKLLLDRDYVLVEPEKLTFLQQVILFNNAQEIISPSGAALANVIFCKPGTRIVILMAKHQRMIYKYWSSMLATFQLRFFYMFGNIINSDNLGIHSDFILDVSTFMDLLEELERE